LVVEGETGYTYAHGNVEEMGDAMRRCLSPEGVRLGGKARELARTNFSIQTVTDRYETLYRQLQQVDRATT
jgi:glycosyltransferase involved in cell wall biosynthesis